MSSPSTNNNYDGSATENDSSKHHSDAKIHDISALTTVLDPSTVLPIRMTSVVVKGYGRGSKDLGIPTANLDRESGQFSTASFEDLPTGIYWGFCRIGTDDHIYKTACSIGYNPYYGNNRKTVEPHLIADPNDTRRHKSSCGESLLGDFYDQSIRLSLVGYLRPELPFEGLDKLIEAIKQDIVNAEQFGDGDAASIQLEKIWVASDDSAIISKTHPG
ncbi:bifunctional riboflavin kinase/FMN adenylyltransferase [Nitzschia inconspicua]|uniref:Bifunctional riboflavin kinase/FMN adenylyltransferase n=1 Tax=Nitzschia inconspicua TaxID=303405 RepID=A0A9K3L1L5_9STRA|nr:bifunctional riboflavin kinase/FMN adenylyltransferase [Nitzschia inconspicua]